MTNHIPIVQYQSVKNLIEKTDLHFDIIKIRQNVDAFLKLCGAGRYRAFETSSKMWALNLNYPPNPEHYDPNNPNCKYVGKLSGNESGLKALGLSSNDFTEMDNLVANSYIGHIYRTVTEWHNKTNPHLGVVNRICVAFMGDGAAYQLHLDPHTGCKYHIPVWTNPYSYMMVDDEMQLKTVSLPADGYMWKLDTNVSHTALNLIRKGAPKEIRIRAHIIIYVS